MKEMMNISDVYLSMNLIQLELFNLLRIEKLLTFLVKSFHLCKFSINKCFLWSEVCLSCLLFKFTVYCVKETSGLYTHFALLHAIICHTVLQIRLK